ncbi:MAG: hypothetical protein HKN92_05075 [Chitinophagales bacterium]|nr:hypothetical protein [Chitinophagales bacterium]
MKKWYAKAIIQKALTFFPFGFKINYLFQKHVTKAVLIHDDFFEDLTSRGRFIIKEAGQDLRGLKFAEIGSGWHPIIPVLLFLNGAEKIVTVDLNSHFRLSNLYLLIQKLLNLIETGKATFPYTADRVMVLKSLPPPINFCLSTQF